MSDIVKDAKADGYVETLLHRRRYIPDINSRNFNLRGFAERTAMNTPIQGSAADIIKLAMVEFDRQIKQTSYHAQLLLQVHDELIFEVPANEVEDFSLFVEEIMEHALQLDVPLKVDSNYGSTWYDAKQKEELEMPELPEVEHVKRGIEPYILNATIKSVTFSNKVIEGKQQGKETIIKGINLDGFRLNSESFKIKSIDRRSKYIVFTIEKITTSVLY